MRRRMPGRLFVDAAPNSDKLGVAWFSGDGVEPNDDAVVVAHAAGRQRAAGDGQERDQRADDPQPDVDRRRAEEGPEPNSTTHGSPLGQDYIVLLSDGMENEADFWSTIRPSIIAAGTTVYQHRARAGGGPGADAEHRLVDRGRLPVCGPGRRESGSARCGRRKPEPRRAARRWRTGWPRRSPSPTRRSGATSACGSSRAAWRRARPRR